MKTADSLLGRLEIVKRNIIDDAPLVCFFFFLRSSYECMKFAWAILLQSSQQIFVDILDLMSLNHK